MNKNYLLIGLIILVVFVIGCSCLACGFLSYGVYNWVQDTELTPKDPVDVEIIPPSPLPTDDSGSDLDLAPIPFSRTLETLLSEEVPINDPFDLALRLEGKENVPLTLPVTDLDRQVGERESFWVTDTFTHENYLVETTLASVTDHLYFWIEDGLEYSQGDLDRLTTAFENNIYPTNRAFFGSERTPGVDEDPRLYIVYAYNLGEGVAGYFSSGDGYHPLIKEYSNAHEMFMLSAQYQDLADGYTYGVLAHEFQHMIHSYRDKNETSWLNEGFAELAILLTNTHVGPTHDYYYADNPDIQLNYWPDDINLATPHYGAAFLFVTYYLDRFGSEATQALVADEQNGMQSVDNVLAVLGLTDPVTGKIITADEVFLDWVVTNYIKDDYNVTERFTYSNYPEAPEFYLTESIEDCPTGPLYRDVHQYGVDYIELNCQGSYTLEFSGQQVVQVLPENPYSGSYAFWSNRGDQSNMHLTREFDFSDVSGPITFSYWTWYDLEEDYDYVFLEISTNGRDWRIIRTPSSTSEDASGNSYGWGYNGLSGEEGDWIEEVIDLSGYAGEVIQLRFEYITDDAVNGEGLLLDDISIPEIEYFTDFENDNGGWLNEGFVRIENVLPQTYRLALIQMGAVPSVQYLSIPSDNNLEIPITIGSDGFQQVVLVVTGTTRFTRQLAEYQLKLVQE